MTCRYVGLLVGAVSLVAASCTAYQAPQPIVDIRADSNRDGVVDDRDAGTSKSKWTASRGAVLLPNIGDVEKRCPSSRAAVSDAVLAACHDAADEVAHAPQHLAPLTTQAIGRNFKGATGRIQAIGSGSDKVRIFIKRNNFWTFLHPEDDLREPELQRGATLGIDARDVVRDPAVWDGNVTVRFIVQYGSRIFTDNVALLVAPVVVHNHTESATTLLVPESGNNVKHQQFVAELGDAARASGLDMPVAGMSTTDTWGQDFVEFGYVSMPGPDRRNISLRIAIRSPQPAREGGRSVFDLRGPGIGAIQIGGIGYRQVDSFGNLEAIPPYSYKGRVFLNGRIIVGDAGKGAAPNSDLLKFFAAQEVQAPLILDTSWLSIGHVDEFIQFLPSESGRGWRPAIMDPRKGLDLLHAISASGRGGERAFSKEGAPVRTIDEVLADPGFIGANELASRKIDENVKRLIDEVGLISEEFVRIPGLYETGGLVDIPLDQIEYSGAPDRRAAELAQIEYGPGTLGSFYPGAINGVVMNSSHYIAPRQWGPVIDGRDVFGSAVEDAYRGVGIAVHYVDDWETHHVSGGEVHCGTNAMRTIGRRR